MYFWAATPVVIACLTFTTYVLLGNELTAAKVFHRDQETFSNQQQRREKVKLPQSETEKLEYN